MCSASNSGSAAPGRAAGGRASTAGVAAKLVEAGPGGRRDRRHGPLDVRLERAHQPLQLLVGDEVALRDHGYLGELLEPGAVSSELRAHRLIALDRSLLGQGVDRDEVDEGPAALDVGEKLVPEPGAL